MESVWLSNYMDDFTDFTVDQAENRFIGLKTFVEETLHTSNQKLVLNLYGGMTKENQFVA